MNDTLLLITLLFTKHFFIDFPFQTKFQYENKGTYLHPGGILHAFLHGFATYFCFLWYAPYSAVFLAMFDAIIHYHIDWAKMNLNAWYEWKPDNSEYFWWLLGLDQFLHALTYVGLVYLVTGN